MTFILKINSALPVGHSDAALILNEVRKQQQMSLYIFKVKSPLSHASSWRVSSLNRHLNRAVWRLQWVFSGCPEDRTRTAADSTRTPPASSLCVPQHSPHLHQDALTKRSSGCGQICARDFCGLSYRWQTNKWSSTCTRKCAFARGSGPRI